jgi:hypothetical protein
MLCELTVFFEKSKSNPERIICTAVIFSGDAEIARKSWTGEHQAQLMHTAHAWWLANYARLSQTSFYLDEELLDEDDGQLHMF